MKDHSKKAVVVLSGGMDSAICLALSIKNFGASKVATLTFDYGQRHRNEQIAAKKIAEHFKVVNTLIDIPFFNQLTSNALLNHDTKISLNEKNPNTLVTGRNGLFARLAAIHAQHLGAQHIYLGVLGLEAANSGYLDCSRKYFDLMEQVLRIDLGTEDFWIHTPLVDATKAQTLQMAHELGELKFILENAVTCYEGVTEFGCGKCPACILKNTGIQEFLNLNPNFDFNYRNKFLTR